MHRALFEHAAVMVASKHCRGSSRRSTSSSSSRGRCRCRRCRTSRMPPVGVSNGSPIRVSRAAAGSRQPQSLPTTLLNAVPEHTGKAGWPGRRGEQVLRFFKNNQKNNPKKSCFKMFLESPVLRAVNRCSCLLFVMYKLMCRINLL